MKERIKQIRKSAKLTQQEFAERLGIKQNTVASYEMGRIGISDAVIFSICREFNINEEWLRTGNGTPTAQQPFNNDIVAATSALIGEKDPIFETFVETYSKLNKSDREFIYNLGMKMLKNLETKKNQHSE